MNRIKVTAEAREHLAEELDGRILRISFTTGCGGSGYRLASADEPQEGDITMRIEDVTIALDDMANKIIAVLRHPPLSQMLKEHGRFEVRQITWDGAARRCQDIYGEVIREMTRPATVHG